MGDEVYADWFIGLDLGRKKDYSAIAVVSEPVFDRRENRWVGLDETDGYTFHQLRRQTHDTVEEYRPTGSPIPLHALKRFPLGTNYTSVVEEVIRITNSEPFRRFDGAIFVDATGVGDAVHGIMQERGINHFPVIITGGQNISWGVDGSMHVPHVRLIGELDVAFDTGRLVLPPDLKELDAFTKELEAFEGQRSESGYLEYQQIRNSKYGHADMVLAAALAVKGRNFYWTAADAMAHDAKAKLYEMSNTEERFKTRSERAAEYAPKLRHDGRWA
jgi:hypothetical protein